MIASSVITDIVCKQSTFKAYMYHIGRLRWREAEAVDAVGDKHSATTAGRGISGAQCERKSATSASETHSDAPEHRTRIVFKCKQLIASAYKITVLSTVRSTRMCNVLYTYEYIVHAVDVSY